MTQRQINFGRRLTGDGEGLDRTLNTMANRSAQAYRIRSTQVVLPEGSIYPNGVGLLFDRSDLAKSAPSIALALRGNVVATTFPERRCVCIYSESRWLELRQLLNRIPNQKFEQRKIRRIALGFETWISSTAPFIVPVTLQSYAGLTGDDVLLVESSEYMELWSTV